jgi:hypothetical protein
MEKQNTPDRPLYMEKGIAKKKKVCENDNIQAP